VPQAGLFSAVTSAFIIQVHSQLQPDPNEETAALLRVLIHKVDNTTFGNEVPPLPQWTGPPRAIVQVQAVLYVSLAASLLSAFLAMLGKQWLSRYASIDMRGSAIERSQNRQRKLDGIKTWYFDYVMDSLPLMLQFALLLLGCALSRYLWEIDTAVASVIIAITSLGAICYALIVVAGATSVSCPYQSPFAQALRYLWRKVSSHPTFVTFIEKFTFASPCSATNGPPEQNPDANPGPEQTPDREATALDFRCVSWMLQISLDRRINELTLKFLSLILALPGFETTIVADCFNILLGCVSVVDKKVVVVVRGSERLAEAAATCLLNAILHSLVVDQESDILKEVQQQYNRIFPLGVDLLSLPFHHTIGGVHSLFGRPDHPKNPGWKDVEPSTTQNLPLAYNLAKVARSCYQRSGIRKVPRWVLRFSLHSLLRSPEPSASVIADCLMIIAIDLGCDVSKGDVWNLDKRYICSTQLHDLLY